MITLLASSTDQTYTGMTREVTVNITENDVAGVVIYAPASTAAEGGSTTTYKIKLNSKPTADITLSLHADSQIGVSDPNPATLTFTPTGWNQKQTVTVSAVNDDLVEGPHTGKVSHTAASTDPNYNNIVIADATIAIADNDSVTAAVASLIDVVEGDLGQTMAAVAVTLDKPSQVPFSIGYQTQDKSAAAGQDYVAATGQVQFVAGQTNQTVLIAIDGDREALLDVLVPMYVDISILRALYESMASELGARMTAMDAATKNAKEMIERLTLQYNRARQAAITKELMEIIGGSEALKE